MNDLNFNIRRARESDSDFLFNLRNEEAVRNASWNTDPVDIESHRNWLAKSLAMSQRFLYVVEVDGEPAGQARLPVGQVRYDISGDGKNAEVSISVASSMVGRGVGTKMLVESAKEFLKSNPGIKIIYAHIKPNNPGSARAFEKSGYQLTKTTEFDGHNCVEMVFLN